MRRDRSRSLNAAAEAWTGWKQAERSGKKHRSGLPASPRQSALRRALSEGALAGFEKPCLVARDGSERAIGGSVSPIRDHNGMVTGAVMVFGEATEAPARIEDDGCS